MRIFRSILQSKCNYLFNCSISSAYIGVLLYFHYLFFIPVCTHGMLALLISFIPDSESKYFKRADRNILHICNTFLGLMHTEYLRKWEENSNISHIISFYANLCKKDPQYLKRNLVSYAYYLGE